MRTWPHDFPRVDSPVVRLPIGATAVAGLISLGCWAMIAHALHLI